MAVADVPAAYRQRWSAQERVIRELVKGANLNANFGYSYQALPNRTVQRHWLEAQARVEVSERKVAEHCQAVQNLKQQAATLRQAYHQHHRALSQAWHQLQTEFFARQAAGQPVRQCQQRLARTQAQLNTLKARYQGRRHKSLAHLRQHRHRHSQASAELSQRQEQRDAFDTASLCRERDLEKDQIMLNLQLLLGNLHHWVRDHYLTPEWQQLELKTATQLIYRKSGWVHWGAAEIEVVLEPYRYPEHQQAMVETCPRFNTANVHWRDGRLLRIRVAPA